MRTSAIVVAALALAACSRRLETYELLELTVVNLWWVAVGVFAIAGALVGAAKDRAVHGALWGFFLGPIGFLVACAMRSHRAPSHVATPPAYAPSADVIRRADIMEENVRRRVEYEAEQRRLMGQPPGEGAPPVSEQQRQYLASLPPDLREQQQRIASGYAASLKRRHE